MPTTALDLTHGITEFSSRIALKMLFAQFGEVTACWIPPLEHRNQERAYVKFATNMAAQGALDAANAGQLFLDGVPLGAQWRMQPARTQDSRDFEARGSNLMTSRDLMRAERKALMEKGGGGGGGGMSMTSRDFMRADRNKDKERDRRKGDKDRSRDRDRKRSRSRDRKRSRSRDKGRRSRSRKRSRDRSASRGKARKAIPEAPVALEDGEVEDEEDTTAIL
mmetsp:Transcript_338/g.1164  ORF Transcript_338/g.1164 Transcript_338/m.1164 type:complete len:222 (-) Transcript_338:87-752(-)